MSGFSRRACTQAPPAARSSHSPTHRPFRLNSAIAVMPARRMLIRLGSDDVLGEARDTSRSDASSGPLHGQPPPAGTGSSTSSRSPSPRGSTASQLPAAAVRPSAVAVGFARRAERIERPWPPAVGYLVYNEVTAAISRCRVNATSMDHQPGTATDRTSGKVKYNRRRREEPDLCCSAESGRPARALLYAAYYPDQAAPYWRSSVAAASCRSRTGSRR